MSVYYRIGEFYFYPSINEIHHQQQQLKVRPKTAELLQVLVEAKGRIVTKSELLENVWHDVAVDEQAVFQSITELRKLFNQAPVIKTHPRKGYSITEPIEVCQHSTEVNRFTANSRFLPVWLICALMLLVAGGWYLTQQGEMSGELAPGSVLVLPVQNHISDADHRWVKYGAMDLLIQHLQPTQNISVLQTEDVMEVLKRAQLKAKSYSAEDISNLFAVSGASLIVEQSLSGSTRDYQLVYSLYQRDETDRGALFSEDIYTAISQLTQDIQQLIGKASEGSKHDYQSDFSNAMLASAVDKLQAGDYPQAIILLRAALVNEPTNLTAQRLLAQMFNYTEQYQQAYDVAATAIPMAARAKQPKEQARLLFWQALSLVQRANFSEGLKLLQEARSLAAEASDWLYLGNIAKVTGRIYQAQQEFTLAQAQYQDALSYHQAIQCPFGQAESLLDLGELAYQQQQLEEAVDKFKASLNMSRNRNLPKVAASAQKALDRALSKS